MELKDFSIKNKVFVFTGGAGHIVGELVNSFARQGARCISTDLRPEKLELQQKSLQENGFDIEISAFDVTNLNAWQQLAQETNKKYKKIDGLINGAGINAPSTFLDVDIEMFKKIIDVNLVGTLIGCQIIGKLMVGQASGSIVNISSTAAAPPLSKAFAYSASKAGVSNLTMNIAREFGQTGVRVNSLRPGFFPTEWNKKNFLSQERIDSILNHTPMKRFGEPYELVGAVQWLLSDASQFVTGAEIIVDGGFACQTI
jgi:NAD(P)-dependent dehydrogenase (short-subunit alcohol dehydrogenase family)